jgi:hypothetical protein
MEMLNVGETPNDDDSEQEPEEEDPYASYNPKNPEENPTGPKVEGQNF